MVYSVQGRRSGSVGPAAEFAVQFGVGSNGQAVATVTEGDVPGQPLQIAPKEHGKWPDWQMAR